MQLPVPLIKNVVQQEGEIKIIILQKKRTMALRSTLFSVRFNSERVAAATTAISVHYSIHLYIYMRKIELE
jgi:hypothetical protein